MNFIQKLVSKYDLNEHEVTTEYAQHLIEEKSLPKAVQINLETIGIEQMDQKAAELQTTIREVTSQKETQTAQPLSRGAIIAKELNENDEQNRTSLNQLWGME